MSQEHNIHAGDTQVGMAVMEILEDRIADVVRHYQDVNTQIKPSKITIELIATPDERRAQFKFSVTGKTTLSARRGFEGTLYGGIDDNGDVKVVEFDPQQLRIPFHQTENAQ